MDVPLSDSLMFCPAGCGHRISKFLVCSGRTNIHHKGLPFRSVRDLHLQTSFHYLTHSLSAHNVNSSRCCRSNKLQQLGFSSRPITHSSNGFCQYNHPCLHFTIRRHSIHSWRIINKTPPLQAPPRPMHLLQQLCKPQNVSVLSKVARECPPKPVVCAKHAVGIVVKDAPPAHIVQVLLQRYRLIRLHQHVHLLHHLCSTPSPPRP
jgi:hypothetical protein